MIYNILLQSLDSSSRNRRELLLKCEDLRTAVCPAPSAPGQLCSPAAFSQSVWAAVTTSRSRVGCRQQNPEAGGLRPRPADLASGEGLKLPSHCVLRWRQGAGRSGASFWRPPPHGLRVPHRLRLLLPSPWERISTWSLGSKRAGHSTTTA